ncbi:hypothetical protein VYU27_006747 [Nannochloropsis oceanica]
MQRRAILSPLLSSATPIAASRHLRHCPCCHHMSSSSSPPASLPSPLPDDPSLTRAYITAIHTLSPSVRQLDLHILCGKSNSPRAPFSFLAGQWVDLYVPNLRHCGGFSMISSPESLPLLSLAIKGSPASRSIHARWAHTSEGAKEGDVVGLRVGGGFHFQMTEEHWMKGTRLVLLAGGVGINPLMSILAHVVGWVEEREKQQEGGKEKEEEEEEGIEKDKGRFQVSLIYSAAMRAELIFEEQIKEWTKMHASWLSVLFIVTRELGGEGAWDGRRERMDGILVWEAVEGEEGERGREKALVYICGPSNMTDEMERILIGGEEEGMEGGRRLRKAQVVTEKWW